MTTLSYLAIDDYSLQEAALHLPLDRVEMKHLTSFAQKAAALHDVVVLYIDGAKAELKNTFQQKGSTI